VIMSWDGYNSADPGSPNDRAIYVQILASDGSLRFEEEGLHIGNKPYYGQGDRTSIVPDGSGGFIASWTTSDASFNMDIIAQRFDSEGAPVWDIDPVAISTNSYNQYQPMGVGDGTGGAIFVWIDERNGDQRDLYAHKFSYDGSSSGLQTPINISPPDGASADVPIILSASEFTDSQGIISHAGSQWRLHSLNTITPIAPESETSGDDAYFSYHLPFSFPFYGRVISSVSVNTNGLIELLEDGEESYIGDEYLTHSNGDHIGHIDAVFAANGDLDLGSGYLRLYNAGDHVVIEWFGATYEDYDDDGYTNAHPLHYQVTLQSDGKISWNFKTFNFSQHEGDLFSGLYPNSGSEIPLPEDIDYIRAHSPTAFEFDPVSRQIAPVAYNWFVPQPVLYDSGGTTDLLSHQLPSSVPLADHTPYYWGVRYKGDNNEWTLWSTPTSFTPDLYPPTIISTVPADQGNNIAVNTTITITFSEEMAAGSITGSISLSGPEGTVEGSVHYSGFTAAFTPVHALTANTTYTATVTTAVTDMVGKRLASEYNWVFTTSGGADTVPPLIVSRTPAANAVDVAVDIAAITFSFNESLQETTIDNSSIVLTGPGGRVPGTLSYDAATYTIEIEPVSTLAYDARYSVTVTTEVKDSAGNPLASSQTWDFTTADTPPPPPLEDTIAPLVISHAPTLASSPVPAVIGVISATFNEIVQGVSGASFIVSHNSVPVPGTVDFDEGGMTARFYPDDDLAFGTTYSVRLIALSIHDLADNDMEHDYTWFFTTSIDPALSGCNPELFEEDGCESFNYFSYGTGAQAGTYRCCIGGYQAEYAARRSVSFEQSHSDSLVDTDNIRSEGEAEVTGSRFRLHITSKRKNDNSDDSGGWAIGASKIQVTGAPPGSVIPMSMVVSGSMPWGSMILQVRDMAHYQMLGAAEGGSTHMYYSNIVDPFAAYSADNYIHTERNSHNIKLDFQYPVEASNGIYVWFIGGTAQYRSTGTNLVDLTARLEVNPPPGVTVRLASGQVFTGPVDSDHDGVADAEDSFPDDGRRATPETPDGGETIAVDVSMNAGVTLSQVQVRDDDDVSVVQDNKPRGYTFPDGLVSFQVNGLQPGATAIVALEFPTPFPAGTRYYKVNDNGFHEFSGAVFSGNRVTLTIRDGGDGDSDGMANGVIVDPGGPAVSSSKKGFWTLMLPAILGTR
ncbi:MAG: Ig-like domain-containing protein, partial [Deltaproteobacteria bacterium]|nr:Ig-like domain-containing protein [Deltaproteobacteria bacterium]